VCPAAHPASSWRWSPVVGAEFRVLDAARGPRPCAQYKNGLIGNHLAEGGPWSSDRAKIVADAPLVVESR
jgi:hypothetical protein